MGAALILPPELSHTDDIMENNIADRNATRRLREWVENFVTEYGRTQCGEDFQSLPPLQRLNIFIRLMSFRLTGRRAMDINMESAMQLPGLATLFTGLDLPKDNATKK